MQRVEEQECIHTAEGVTHVGNKPMLIHVINSAESAGQKIHVVVGNDGERMKDRSVDFLSKTRSRGSTKGAAGTAHAVQQAVSSLESKAKVIIYWYFMVMFHL